MKLKYTTICKCFENSGIINMDRFNIYLKWREIYGFNSS